MERRPLWNSGRPPHLELSTQSECLGLSCQAALNEERVTVDVLDHKFEGVPQIALLPIYFNKPGDCERLRQRADLVPGTAQKKEETLADFGAVRQKDFRPHALRRRTSGAMRVELRRST